MMPPQNSSSGVILVDTTSYAGGFERELCAYATGHHGECGVGSEIAARVRRDIIHLDWWKANIRNEPDDDRGCRRPAAVWATPGWFTVPGGGTWRDTPENYEPARLASIEGIRRDFEPERRQIQRRLDEEDFDTDETGPWTKEACLRKLAADEEKIRTFSTRRYPAQLSAAIFVAEAPPADVIAEFKERAAHFCANRDSIDTHLLSKGRIELTGFRFIAREHRLDGRSI
jgi:hypothetical protein